MDDTDLLKTADLGREARSILTMPAFEQAFNSLSDEYKSALFKSKPEESALREQMYLKLKVLAEVKDALGIIEQSGVKADHDVKARRRSRNAE